MPRHCLTMDLKDDPRCISEYKRWHVAIWPEVRESLFAAGVVAMEIYLLETRMFMIMDVGDSFTMARKAEMDLGNARVQEWEAAMGEFLGKLPWAKPGERWMEMDRVFSLAAQCGLG